MIHNPAASRADAEFRTSSFTDGQNCVEVAWAAIEFGVRDSKNESGPVLMFGEAAARSFLASL